MTVTVHTVAVLVSIVFILEKPLTAYNRPDSSSSVFGTLEAGEYVDITVRTLGGWLGFDPGTAQASNTGSFRYRWLPPESTSAGTDTLEAIWAPEPGITYAMTFEKTQVFAHPDTGSVLLATLESNSAAQVTDATGNWVKVNLNNSPVPENIQGWISLENISLNFE